MSQNAHALFMGGTVNDGAQNWDKGEDPLLTEVLSILGTPTWCILAASLTKEFDLLE